MDDLSLLDIDAVPADRASELAASMRALLRLQDVDDTNAGDTLLALTPEGELLKIAVSDLAVAKFVAGLAGVEIVTALPTTGNFVGRMVFLTTDKKLYRYDGTSFTAAVPAADITGQLSDDHIAAVGVAKLTGQIVAAQIANAAITTAKFASGIVPVEIVATLPTTGNFVGRTALLTTDKKLYRYDGSAFTAAVAAADIAGQIGTTQIADGSISTPKLAAGSITAAQIAADSITAAQIAAGAIGVSELAAGSVVASKLFVGDFSNMFIDANMAETAMWSGSALLVQAETPVPSASRYRLVIALSTAAAFIAVSANALIPVEGGKPYFFSSIVGAYGANAATYDLRVNWYSKDDSGNKALISQSVDGAVTTSGLVKTSAIFTAPANAAYAEPTAYKAVSASAAPLNWMEPIFRRATTGELIVDGAITTLKMTANSINGDRIAANTLDAGKIVAGSITTDRMTANSISGDRITAGSMNADKLIANSIITGLIAAGAITAAQIATGAITAAKIAAGTITADKLSIASLAAISGSLGAVDISSAVIGTLTVGTINIAGGAVTDAKIDQTAPGAPGTPTLTPLSADFDQDGTIDAGFLVAWTAPGSGRAPAKYLVEIFRRLADKGTDGDNITGYALWRDFTTPQINKQIAGNARYFHKARITPLSPNDIKGTPSAYTSVGLQPGARGNPTAPSYTVESYISGAVLKGIDVSDPDYKLTEIFYKNQPGTPSASQDALATAVGSNCVLYLGTSAQTIYFWARTVNRSGKKSAWTAPTSTAISYPKLKPYEVFAAGAQFLTATVAKIVATQSVDTNLYGSPFDATAAANDVLINMSFTNADGTSERIFKVEVFENSTSIFSQTANRVADDGSWHMTFLRNGPAAGAAVSYRMEITCSTSTNVRNVRLGALVSR